MSDTEREYTANYRQPPSHTRFKKGQSGNPRGRPAKNLAAHQLVNKSASAELRAIKMLIDMLRDIEKGRSPYLPQNRRSVRPTRRWSNSWSPGCAATCATPWAAQRGGLEASPTPAPAGEDAMDTD
jgi:hypothetical protein